MLAACHGAETQQKIAQSIWSQPSAPAYDYPIRNPYAATVISVPPEMRIDFSDMPKPDEREMTVFANRQIPEGYWYERGLKYSQLLQDKPAPLVYVIAGTGASFRAEKMLTIGYTLYSAGFHVVLLSSPTHQNFIINASENYIVGRPRQSAADLYRVMRRIDARVTEEVGVTGRMLTGYSLGGLDAAFAAKLDEEQRQLNFSRVLLINPPYDLYHSTQIISDMIYQGLPHGMDDADGFIKTALLRLSSMRQSGDALDFSNERLLIDAYEKYAPDDAKLAATIGLSFRLSAANMVFASDVMSKSGYVFPKDREFTTGTNLSHSMALALRTSFVDYVNEFYEPRIQRFYPGTTHAQIMNEAGLGYLDSYIRGNAKFGLITNMDDIILAPGEAEKLAGLFGKNAYVFNNGGHVGNLAHPTVGYYMVRFLQGGQP